MCPLCSVNACDASSPFHDLKGASSGFSRRLHELLIRAEQIHSNSKRNK